MSDYYDEAYELSEKVNKQLAESAKEINVLQAKNKQQADVLAFYANTDNYQHLKINGEDCQSEIEMDHGDKARWLLSDSTIKLDQSAKDGAVNDE